MLETRTHNLEEKKKKNGGCHLAIKSKVVLEIASLWYFGALLGFFSNRRNYAVGEGSVYPHSHLYTVHKQRTWLQQSDGHTGLRPPSLTSAAEETQVVLSDVSAVFKLENIDIWFCFCLSKTPNVFSAWVLDYRRRILFTCALSVR